VAGGYVRGYAMARKRRQSESARTAAVRMRSVAVTLRPPYYPNRQLPPLTVNGEMCGTVNSQSPAGACGAADAMRTAPTEGPRHSFNCLR
jgi:hypothetical protein